jgi:hypothetical protein
MMGLLRDLQINNAPALLLVLLNMYCDLNIPCSAHADRSAIDKLKLILSRLTQGKLAIILNLVFFFLMAEPFYKSVSEYAVALNYTMEGFHTQNVRNILVYLK